MIKKKVEWSILARASLEYYCSRIAEESPSSAMKVRREIVMSAKALSKNPTLYQIDEYYPDNQGDIRRFFRWDYRVVYQVRKNTVVVLNIFHTSQRPDRIK